VGLFSRSRKQPAAATPPAATGLSPITGEELAGYGRFEFDPQSNPLPGDLEYRAWQLAQSDQEAFLRNMAGNARAGGWAAYGAERLIVSVISGDLQHPLFDEVMLAALTFLRENLVPPSRLSGYEWSWWSTHQGASEAWLIGSAPPSQQDADIPQLRDSEERVLAQMTAQPNGNLIVAVQRGDHVVALIDAPWSDEDPTRSRNEWQSAPNLHELYLKVGAALQAPPHWVRPELVPYIPLPPSNLP
jgi:hypothetical protein